MSKGICVQGPIHTTPYWGTTPSVVEGHLSLPLSPQRRHIYSEGFAMSKRIPLTQGKFAIVEDADFEWLNQWKWYARKARAKCYASRKIREERKQKTINMHYLIVNPPSGMEPDHRNGDGLDNRRANLRCATRSQNNMNRHKRCECSSKYKGVYWEKIRQKWHAQITIHGKVRFLGRFANEQDAGLAYNAEAQKHFGKFARLCLVEKDDRGACLADR